MTESQSVTERSAPVTAVEDSTGSVKPAPGARLLGSDPYDDLSLGKKHYRANNFGLAEKHFRRAVEKHPRDAEAWLGLAASYDRLRRFDLADRAYAQAIGILGPTVEILNNQGYSYMLRGDYKRARETLAAARRKDPNNKYVQNNMRLLEESYRKGKSVE
ncbi:MAG TPA: tetratricopeptide repeat protein [Pseudolabrys sp.]|nr:tetratricopeptide repeat protein [Pseudolabrys sp.]